MKTKVTMTLDQLEHLFISMDTICAAGSENDTDAEIAILLAKAMNRRGLNSPAVDSWLKNKEQRYTIEFDGEPDNKEHGIKW